MIVQISSIEVGERHRKSLGDLSTLARSMAEVGLLHPVVLTMDGKLVAGERRLRAAEQLGWTRIEARKIDLSDPLLAERDENAERKPLTKSEAVAVAREIEAVEKEKAKARQGTRTDLGEPLPENFSEGESGRALDKAAEAVGMSRPTLEKATEVVEAAEADPEAFGDLVERMDETGKVDPVHRELEERRADLDPETGYVVTDWLQEQHCPTCGRDTPMWVVHGRPAPEGAHYRWLSRIRDENWKPRRWRGE